MPEFIVPPAFVLMGGALVVALLPGRLRQVAMLAIPIIAGVALWQLTPESSFTYQVAGYEMVFLKVDALSRVFAIVLIGVTFIGMVYALHVKGSGQHVAALLYAAGSLGVVFAGDWITLFLFWELMATASVFLIWFRKEKAAIASGHRYFLVHTAGGGLLLTGILMHLAGGGSPEVGVLTGLQGPAFWLILLGVALNTAIPPLHAWLPDAYGHGTITGSVFLSAFTTKTAVFVLLRVFPGTDVLVAAGVIMALYGVVFAVLENDIRRLLAYHIVSQVGYMVAAAGMGVESEAGHMALNGAAAHAFSHILYKSLLFMGAGAVIYATGLRKLSDLGGIYKKMPLVLLLYAVGAASISGFPGFNGFISKSMIISAAAEGGIHWVALLLTLASIGTFLHTGLKLLYFTFLGPDKGIEVRPIPMNMKVAMAMGAAACTFFGIWYKVLYRWLPYAEAAVHDYHPYTWAHVIAASQLLIATFLGFYYIIEKLDGERTITLDTDWPYRVWIPKVIAASLVVIERLSTTTSDIARAFQGVFFEATNNPVRRSPFLRDAFTIPRPDRDSPYDANTDRLPISITVGAALCVFGGLALVYWIVT